ISSISFSRSMRLSSGFSVSHRCSIARRMSRRMASEARSFTRLRSSRSTSLEWICRFSSSKFFPDPPPDPPKLGLDSRDMPVLPPWALRLFSFEIPCCNRDIGVPQGCETTDRSLLPAEQAPARLHLLLRVVPPGERLRQAEQRLLR